MTTFLYVIVGLLALDGLWRFVCWIKAERELSNFIRGEEEIPKPQPWPHPPERTINAIHK